MRTLVASLVALILTAASAPAARACSCAVAAPADAMRAATLVFEGTLEDIRQAGDRHIGRFRVHRVWKGTLGARVEVDVFAQPSMCPPHLEAGGRYILYVSGGGGEPHRVTQCARYAAGERLASERRALGRGRAPTGS